MNTPQHITTQLLSLPLLEERLSLQLSGVLINIRSNSSQLLQQLQDYFRHTVTADSANGVESDSIEVIAIEQPTLQ
ncbi:MAG: hypothetical protein Q9M13_06440, partial [Mariprofundales bacterium]|nr:hypothetical protein [Mariprofundales bacterium]